MTAWTIVGALIALAVGIIAVKFDFNRWLEYRREARRERARSLCPHDGLHCGAPIRMNGYAGEEDHPHNEAGVTVDRTVKCFSRVLRHLDLMSIVTRKQTVSSYNVYYVKL